MGVMSAALLLLACSGEDPKQPTETGDTAAVSGDTDTGPPLQDQESASSFSGGQYRTASLYLLGEEEGIDLNGDEVIDNSLPGVLTIVDLLGVIDADMSLEGVNATLEAAIAAGDVIQLVEAGQEGALLTVDLLLGAEDKAGALSVDPASYDESGAPASRLQGSFSTETTFAATSDTIQIPFSFIPGDPPLFIPVVEVSMAGELGAAASGQLYGVIPVDAMVNQVLEPLIPTGDAYDPASYLGYEREEFLGYLTDFSNEQLADIELADGSMGFSAALGFQAEASAW